MHKQAFFEINIVIRGEGVHCIGEREVKARIGDVFIIPPEMEHGYVGGAGFDVYHIIINNNFMQSNMARLREMDGFSVLFNVEPLMRGMLKEPYHLTLTDSQFCEMWALIKDYKDHRHYTTPTDGFIYTGMIYIVIAKLCEIYSRNNSCQKEKEREEDIAFMRSIALIHERYSDSLTISALAREARLSKSSYMRKFIAVCGMPPNKYITKKRLESAKNLLSGSNTSITEIAEEVGFYDSSHLSRTFKREYGISPFEYRRISRQNVSSNE